MLLDFSDKPELGGLARVVGVLQAMAAPLGVEFFLMGAAGAGYTSLAPHERSASGHRALRRCRGSGSHAYLAP